MTPSAAGAAPVTRRRPAFNVPASGDYIVTWSYSNNVDPTTGGGTNFWISENGTGSGGDLPNDIATSGVGEYGGHRRVRHGQLQRPGDRKLDHHCKGRVMTTVLWPDIGRSLSEVCAQATSAERH